MGIDILNARESLGFLTWKVTRLLTNDLTARFSEAGVNVTVEQWRALIPIYKFDGMTQGKLCEVMSQEKTGVSRLVAALEKQGLIRRESSRDDRRVKYLFITDSGRDLIDSTMDLVVESRDNSVANLDPEELAICKKVLWQIVEASFDGHCPSNDGKS